MKHIVSIYGYDDEGETYCEDFLHDVNNLFIKDNRFKSYLNKLAEIYSIVYNSINLYPLKKNESFNTYEVLNIVRDYLRFSIAHVFMQEKGYKIDFEKKVGLYKKDDTSKKLR